MDHPGLRASIRIYACIPSMPDNTFWTGPSGSNLRNRPLISHLLPFVLQKPISAVSAAYELEHMLTAVYKIHGQSYLMRLLGFVGSADAHQSADRGFTASVTYIRLLEPTGGYHLAPLATPHVEG